MTELATRGTTNRNRRGGSDQRRRRRAYLVETYRADVDTEKPWSGTPLLWDKFRPVPLGEGIPSCRCYRCGVLLTEDTVTVDRIVPACKGGTYRRNNIRPACGPCNSVTGGGLRGAR